MKFGVLDISQDPINQGYELSSFDFILGFNVVHATSRIEKTLANLKPLLVPGGTLLLVEAVKSRRWDNLIWGLAQGLWYFEDTDLRKHSPLLDAETWENVLRKLSFSSVKTFPQDEAKKFDADHCLIIARKETMDASNQAERVKELERLGAKVMILDMPASTPDSIRQAVGVVQQRFNRIDGIVHTGLTGGADDFVRSLGMIKRQLSNSFEALASLEELAATREVDFIALISRQIPSRTEITQHVMASLHEAFARYWSARHGVRAISIQLDVSADESSGFFEPVSNQDAEDVFIDQFIQPRIAATGVAAPARAIAPSIFTQIISRLPSSGVVVSSPGLRPRDAYGDAPTQSKNGVGNSKLSQQAPRNELERVIAGIWQEMLGVEQVAIRDNFFDLGGDSLISVQIMSRLRESLTVELPVRILFEYPTVEKLASAILQKEIEQTDSQTLAEALTEIVQLSADEIEMLLTVEQPTDVERNQ